MANSGTGNAKASILTLSRGLGLTILTSLRVKKSQILNFQNLASEEGDEKLNKIAPSD